MLGDGANEHDLYQYIHPLLKHYFCGPSSHIMCCRFNAPFLVKYSEFSAYGASIFQMIDLWVCSNVNVVNCIPTHFLPIVGVPKSQLRLLLRLSGDSTFSIIFLIFYGFLLLTLLIFIFLCRFCKILVDIVDEFFHFVFFFEEDDTNCEICNAEKTPNISPTISVVWTGGVFRYVFNSLKDCLHYSIYL